jgi:hypothetical protein
MNEGSSFESTPAVEPDLYEDNSESVHSDSRRSHASNTRSREQRVQRAMDVQDQKLAVKLKTTRKSETQNLTESAVANSYGTVGTGGGAGVGVGGEESKSHQWLYPVEQADLCYWSLYITAFLLGIVTAFFTPYRLSFDNDNPTLRILDFSMDGFFLFFLLFQALHVIPHHFSHLQSDSNIMGLRGLIAREYVLKWRSWVDLLSALPFDLIASSVDPAAGGRVVFCLGLLRLGRMVRVFDFFAEV